MDFEEELKQIRKEKKQLEEEIEELEAELSVEEGSLEDLRHDIDQLKKLDETGEIPDDEKAPRQNVPGIDSVELNENGNPPRGARSKQIEQAVRKLGRQEDEFKAAEIFDLLTEADPNFGEKQRAYLYSKLDELKEEGVIDKVRRGTWTLS